MDNNKITQLEESLVKLTQELQYLRDYVYKNDFSDNKIFEKKLIMNKSVSLGEASDISIGTSTGTKIGTSSTQKIGFYGATPVVRQGSITAPSGGSTIDSQARSSINAIIATLQTLGLTA